MILIQYEGIWGYCGIWGDMGGYGTNGARGPRVPYGPEGPSALHWLHIPPYPPISHNIPHIPSYCIKIIYIYIHIYIIFRVPWISCIFQTRFRFHGSRPKAEGFRWRECCERSELGGRPGCRTGGVFLGPLASKG